MVTKKTWRMVGVGMLVGTLAVLIAALVYGFMEAPNKLVAGIAIGAFLAGLAWFMYELKAVKLLKETLSLR